MLNKMLENVRPNSLLDGGKKVKTDVLKLKLKRDQDIFSMIYL